jgi:hypothetical protein
MDRKSLIEILEKLIRRLKADIKYLKRKEELRIK